MAIAFYAIPKLLFDGERGDKCVRHLFVQAAMLIRLHLQSAVTHRYRPRYLPLPRLGRCPVRRRWDLEQPVERNPAEGDEQARPRIVRFHHEQVRHQSDCHQYV